MLVASLFDPRKALFPLLAMGPLWVFPTWSATEKPGPGKVVPGTIAELLDGAQVPGLKPWRVFQVSGYDRDGGFYDSGNFCRVEPGPRFVLLESFGPGVIDRMWFTYKGEFRREPYQLLIYLDGQEQPLVNQDLDDLFTVQRPPFVAPLAGLCGSPQHPARYSFVPIGFLRSAKIVLRPTAPPDQYNYRENSRGERIPHIYYQVTWRKLAPGASVHPFSWDLDEPETQALNHWLKVCSQIGPTPWSASIGRTTARLDVTVEPGTTSLLAEYTEPGTICGLRLKTESPEGLHLLAEWDGQTVPAVFVPLGPFFACAEAMNPESEVRGLWLGRSQGAFYSHLPMPFHRSARLLLKSSRSKPVRVSGEIDFERKPPHPSMLCLHARRYHYAPPKLGTDYVLLDIPGQGHFAGLVMDRPGHMEGDDSFFVDGEEFPSLHGTGTEDFFNFAWGLSHTAALPLHGITQQPGGPVAYRFHLPAGIPFSQSLRLTWEHGHDLERGPNLDQSAYSGVVFYYARQGS